MSKAGEGGERENRRFSTRRWQNPDSANDLYFDGDNKFSQFLSCCAGLRWEPVIQVVYELNGLVRLSSEDQAKLRQAWAA